MSTKLFKWALLAAIALPGVAVAADYEPPPPVDGLRPATYDWTGVYAGVWGGSACIDGTLDDQTDVFLVAGCGIKGGGTIGYNYQYNDWVVGVEGDYGFGSKVADNQAPGAKFTYKINSIGTARVRAGYAFDDTLMFLTVGLAFGEGNLHALDATSTPFKDKRMYTGFTVGGGIEHALTDNLRIRLDYLYTAMSKKRFNPDCTTVCTLDLDWGGEHEVRLGAVWAFNWF